MDNNGATRGRTARLSLRPLGRVIISDSETFVVTASGAGLEGYLRISSDTTLIAGAVRFGDAAETQFQTSLPLVVQGHNELIYAQVAQDDTYFTGLAVVNANNEPANAVISIFNRDGVQVGTGGRTIAANARFSEVLPQLDPLLPALSSGYFKVTSDRPVLSFGVFGTHTLSVLAAIPGQPVLQ